MSQWKPGDVAIGTVDDRPTRLFRIEKAQGSDCGWSLSTRLNRSRLVADRAVSDARPLMVIDPEDREAVERLAGLLARNGKVHEPFTGAWPDKVQAAVRDFTTPPLTEPTGIGAVVEDEAANRWVLVPGEGDDLPEWVCSHSRASWSSVEAVRVLSEGVTP